VTRRFEMKIKVIMLSISLLVVLISASCFITSRDISVDLSCDQLNDESNIINEFRMESGDKLRIRLCSNPSTGFEWTCIIKDNNVIKEEDHDYEEDNTGNAGSAGVEMWTFEAVAKGITEINMAYSQPWEGGEKDVWTYKISVVVE